MSFVPFFFHLSCPFKIRYFNLGVFPATIDWNRELAGCRWGKAYPRALHIPGHTGDSFLFLFFFKWRLLNQQCSHSLTACLWRPSSCSPVKPFMIYRDDMNVSRSRSALPIEKLDFQVSGGNHLLHAFGWISPDFQRCPDREGIEVVWAEREAHCGNDMLQ